MGRRLKEYRARNADDSGTQVKDFFTEAIGYPNVLVIDAMLQEEELLPKMKEIIEQKGKPCCINMITDEDNKFLANLEKMRQKELRQKAREAAAAEAEANPPEEGEEPVPNKELEESEEEVDEVTQMINQREQENAERAKAEEAARKQ